MTQRKRKRGRIFITIQRFDDCKTMDSFLTAIHEGIALLMITKAYSGVQRLYALHINVLPPSIVLVPLMEL
jgi:hypothetical protein